MSRYRNIKLNAFTVIEVLVAVSVITTALAAFVALGAFSLGVSTRMRETAEALALAEEALEEVRNFRDNVSWNNDDLGNQYDGLGVLAIGLAYHPALSGDTPARVMLAAGAETSGRFTRQVVFDAVRRDGSNNIVASGGTVDAGTKQATARVSWPSGSGTREVELVTYVMNWR